MAVNVGRGLSRGASGAATGAVLGSIVPGVGNVAGGIIGGAIGLGTGLFSSSASKPDPKLSAFAERQLSGEIDPVALNALQNALRRRTQQQSRQIGADFARRGLTRSDIAGQAAARPFETEQQALSETLATQQLARQRLGAGLLSDFDAQRLREQEQDALTLGNILQLAALLSGNAGGSAGQPSPPTAS